MQIKTLFTITVLSFISLALISCKSERAATQAVQVVDMVDASRYQGKWYEIARFPHRFQKGCENVYVEYGVIDEKTISVDNYCIKNGEPDSVHGKALMVEGSNGAKYKVHFEGFPQNLFAGDYWVVKLATDYSYAVVSEGSGSYLWILSRTPEMSAATYDSIVKDLKKRGFKTEYLQKTVQC